MNSRYCDSRAAVKREKEYWTYRVAVLFLRAIAERISYLWFERKIVSISWLLRGIALFRWCLVISSYIVPSIVPEVKATKLMDIFHNGKAFEKLDELS